MFFGCKTVAKHTQNLTIDVGSAIGVVMDLFKTGMFVGLSPLIEANHSYYKTAYLMLLFCILAPEKNNYSAVYLATFIGSLK
jgi:hypothetical protein